MKRSVLAILSLLSTAAMADQTVTSSFQGYSGLINIPTADLFDEGKFYFQYSNQTERLGSYRDTPNVNFGIGLWNLFEISGRNSAYDKSMNGLSDLSANVKFAVPYIPQDWFSLSLGIQDLGGAANNYGAKYAVASKNIFDNVNLSVGFGQSDSRQGRLDGAFAGISWQPYDWAKLSIEYDAADTNVGLHLASPQHWFNNELQITANVQAYSSNEQLNDKFYYGVGINIPLWSTKPAKKKSYDSYRYQAQNLADISDMLERTKSKLTKQGFESIRIGETGLTTVYVELENHIYNRNQLDGLGVALAIISTNLSDDYKSFKLVFKERELPIVVVSGSIADYIKFLNNELPLNIDVSTDTYNAQVGARFIDQRNSNSSWLKPRLTFWPSLVSTVGTDLGMFDASVALVSHLELPLWRGGSLTGQHITQLAETEDFKDGRAFDDRKQQTGLQEYSLHQTFSLPFDVKNMTSLGRYRHSYNFLSNNIRWQNNNGVHRVDVVTSKYENQITPQRTRFPGCNILFAACWKPLEPTNREVFIGKYRYYSARFNTSAELQVGKYWQQDKGVKLSLKRMFGDVSINLSYKNTKLDHQEKNQLVSIGFTIPLTPRKDYTSKYLQVRGNPSWSHNISTLVGKSHNNLTPGTGDSAQQFYNLENAYYNFDRLSQKYIYNNATRVKKAAALAR